MQGQRDATQHPNRSPPHTPTQNWGQVAVQCSAGGSAWRRNGNGGRESRRWQAWRACTTVFTGPPSLPAQECRWRGGPATPPHCTRPHCREGVKAGCEYECLRDGWMAGAGRLQWGIRWGRPHHPPDNRQSRPTSQPSVRHNITTSFNITHAATTTQLPPFSHFPFLYVSEYRIHIIRQCVEYIFPLRDTEQWPKCFPSHTHTHCHHHTTH